MNLPLAFLASSLVVFSSGYYVGQYNRQSDTSNVIPIPHAAETVVLADESTIAKSDPPLCINEVIPNSSVKATDEHVQESLTVAEEPSEKDSAAVELPPPLSEEELLQNMSVSAAESLAIEIQFRNADISLLETTLADMIEKGEPDDLIEELRKDLSQLQQDVLPEVEFNDDSVEVTKEERQEELIQSLSNEGIPLEESEQVARDMFQNIESNPTPAEVEDPPTLPNEDS